MKKTLIKILEKPKIVIPVFAILAIIVGAIFYFTIGRTPSVGLSSGAEVSSGDIQSTSSVDLAFPKAGRLGSLSVALGDKVQKGDVIASLDAGDALGAVNQTKGALELAKAQYASLNVQYANTKNQQDVAVENAYRALLSGALAPVAQKADNNNLDQPIDNNQAPEITGTYTCDKEGSYEIDPYPSQTTYGFSYTYKGLEMGSGDVTYYTSQPLGSCGLFIQFPVGYSSNLVKWIVNIPNTKSAVYISNKNAYDLAVANRDQALKQLEANLGKNGSMVANVAQAGVDSAEGAYETALAAYKNDLIITPMDGTVTFVDSHLKVGQAVTANKNVITISEQ